MIEAIETTLSVIGAVIVFAIGAGAIIGLIGFINALSYL